MTETITEAIIYFFRNLFNNDMLTTFFIAFLPIVELRGAVPVAIEMGLEWWQALGLAYVGSSVIAPILLLLLKPVLNLLKRLKFFNRFATAIENMFKEKAEAIALKAGKSDGAKRENRIKILGVYAFVALPLPLTGVWTGTAVAVFLGLPFGYALGAVLLGNLTAGAIMTVLSIFLQPHLDIILTVFFVLVLLLLIFFIVKVVIRMIRLKHTEIKKAESDNDTCDNDDAGLPAESDNAEDDNVILGKGLSARDADEYNENKE